MHAVVGTVSMDRSHFEAQQAYLHDDLVPRAQQQRGFRAGYWMYDEGAALGRMTLVFDSETDARGFWRVLGDVADLRREIGISFTELHVVRVLAHASA